MDKRIVYAAVIGVALYLVIFYLNMLQGDLTFHQLLLIIVTPLIVGIVSGKIKNAAAMGFIISFVMLAVEVFVIQNTPSNDANIVFTVLIAMVLPLALISTALAAAGGLIGKKVIKK